MLTLKKVKELVEAPSHAKRTPSPKMLFEEGIVLLRREFDQGSHLTVYNSGYVLFSAGKRNTVFHIHDCQGDYAYDAAEGKGDVIEEEYFENCEWHIRALFEGERKMEDNQAKCEDAGRSNVCVSYHALSEDWSEVADRTIGLIPKFDKLIATIRSREISASIILQSQSQLKTIYKDAAETIIGNCDTMLFLGGKESSTLKEISETLGKETIDLYNTSDTRGQSPSFGTTYQKTGKELMSRDELSVMDGSKCILQLRGVRPFLSDKFDITKHKRYKELSDFDKKNAFDVERYLKHELRLRMDEEFDCYEVDVSEESTA